MNWDIIEGNWTQFKGVVKVKWGKLTDDRLDVIAGKRDQLVGGIQEAYGITRDQADVQLKAFEAEQDAVDKIADTMPAPTKALPPEAVEPAVAS